MGTTYHITFFSPTEVDKKALQTDIDVLLEHINDVMSTYRPKADISRFNTSDSTDKFSVHPDMLTVMQASQKLSKESLGGFDVTLGPLINVWGFGPKGIVTKAPTDAEIQQLRTYVGFEKITLYKDGLAKSHPKTRVSLSAIAKGYGVDRVAELLAEKGIQNYLVEIGGEMRLSGKKPTGESWKIAVEKPVAMDRAVQKILEPGNNGVATSGSYRNYFEENGIRYSHTIDPRTGKPITHNLVSVTVFHPSAMLADGLATAITVLGPQEGLAFANKHEYAVMLVTKAKDGFEEHYSKAFLPYVK